PAPTSSDGSGSTPNPPSDPTPPTESTAEPSPPASSSDVPTPDPTTSQLFLLLLGHRPLLRLFAAVGEKRRRFCQLLGKKQMLFASICAPGAAFMGSWLVFQGNRSLEQGIGTSGMLSREHTRCANALTGPLTALFASCYNFPDFNLP